MKTNTENPVLQPVLHEIQPLVENEQHQWQGGFAVVSANESTETTTAADNNGCNNGCLVVKKS